jgi:hypothetical protein
VTVRLARLLGSHGSRSVRFGRFLGSKVEGCTPVKKLLLLVLIAAGAFAVWRKVQADRAELDLWTEATTDDN